MSVVESLLSYIQKSALNFGKQQPVVVSENLSKSTAHFHKSCDFEYNFSYIWYQLLQSLKNYLAQF